MMKHTLLYIAVSGMTLLTSCQLGKHYTRPDLHLPQQLDTLRQQDTLSIADMQWWEIYTDTTLQSLIEKTLDNNKDMKIAAARVKDTADVILSFHVIPQKAPHKLPFMQCLFIG